MESLRVSKQADYQPRYKKKIVVSKVLKKKSSLKKSSLKKTAVKNHALKKSNQVKLVKPISNLKSPKKKQPLKTTSRKILK